MAFTGFTDEALDFYRRLELENSKAFWEANRATFVSAVRDPMRALTDELSDVGRFHLFRPHNDLRFSKQRPPYKTHQGAYVESEGGAGYYLQLSASGLMIAAGYYAMATDQLSRFRDAVDDERTGSEIASVTDDLVRRRYSIGAIGELKTAPRGFPKDHPRIDLLRRKGLMASIDVGAPAWIRTRTASARIRKVWDGAAELCAWLDAHVGPSTLPPDDRP
jgi:uncharacterized protein (TIGR02453 family)